MKSPSVPAQSNPTTPNTPKPDPPPDLNAPPSNAQRLAELAALVDAVKQRVRAQYPESSGNGSTGVICVGLPDLTPLARARDAAAGKMAAIGTVNPRPGGLVNNSIQSVKRAVSRALNWFVRDQVVFNRQMIACIETCIESLADVNRTIHALAGQANTQIQLVRAEAEPLRVEARTLRAKTSELRDLASHWHRWREEWQLKLHRNEVEFLKSVADLNTSVHQKIVYLEAASQQRITGIENSMQELHRAYELRIANLQSGFEERLAETHTAYTRSAADLQRAYEQQIKDLHESYRQETGKLGGAFEKTAAELDASYQQIARQLEAACQQTAHRVENTFAATVAPLEAGFRETVTQLEASFRETLTQSETSFERRVDQLESAYNEQIAQFDRRASQVEHNATASLQVQHDAYEQLTNSHAETIQRSTTEQIEALAAESRQSSASMDQRLVGQTQDFERLLATSITEVQKKFYADLDRIRTEYERVIHAELRVVRQRMGAPAAAPVLAKPIESPSELPFDYARFADRFRGSEQHVADSQRFYVPYFAGRRHVLDIGCGRGEFLGLLREAGVPAKGIESSEESVAYCRSLDLDATNADLFVYLADQPEGTLDGIFCSQVVEHLPPMRLPEMVRLCASRLSTGGILAIETPNPECLAIFATHFYLDPTHTRPVPAHLLAFYMEEFGLGRIEVHRRAPAPESIPEASELPEGFREKFFDGLDYAIIAYKL